MDNLTIKNFRRRLHITALLQNNKDSRDWNVSTLTKLIFFEESLEDENDPDIIPSESIIKKRKPKSQYITEPVTKAHIESLKKNKGIIINTLIGGRRTEIDGYIPEDELAKWMKLYISLIVNDITTDSLIRRMIKEEPERCMWNIATIYFASIQKKQIRFDYKNNDEEESCREIFNPYYLISKNHNIYLIGRDVVSKKKDSNKKPTKNLKKKDEPTQLILEKIKNLKVLETKFHDNIPDPSEYFKYSISPFMNYNPVMIKIRYHDDIRQSLEQILINIGEIKTAYKNKPNKSDNFIAKRNCGDFNEAEFLIGDPEHLLKHLFFYGDKVEILEPEKFRNKMKQMLEDSLQVYK